MSVVLACLLLASCASRHCTTGSEFEPALCAANLPQISQLTIREHGVRSPHAEAAVRCEEFRLSDLQVRMFFSAAQQADANDAHHTLDWLPCHTSGDVQFSDGRAGQWTINQSRVGSLVIDGGDAITLYCPRCRFAPFK